MSLENLIDKVIDRFKMNWMVRLKQASGRHVHLSQVKLDARTGYELRTKTYLNLVSMLQRMINGSGDQKEPIIM